MTSCGAMNCIRLSESEESGGSGDARPADWESTSACSKEFTKPTILQPPSTIQHCFTAQPTQHCFTARPLQPMKNPGPPKAPTVPDFDAESNQSIGCSCTNNTCHACRSEYEHECAESDEAPPPMIPRVPKFEDDGNSCGCDCDVCLQYKNSGLLTDAAPWGCLFNENLMSSLLEYFSCPICHDPMTEATAANCGHAFCSSCLQTWLKKKPVCPICSKEVTCCIRQFNVDHLIEDAVRELSKDATNDDSTIANLSQSILVAASERAQKAETESKKIRIYNNLKQQLDKVRILYHCKGYTGIFNTMSHSSLLTGIKRRFAGISSRRNVSTATSDAIHSNCHEEGASSVVSNERRQVDQPTRLLNRRCRDFALVASGVLIALTYFNLTACTQFFWYCWLCLTKYNGSIPNYLLKDEGSPPPPPPPSPSSWWNR